MTEEQIQKLQELGAKHNSKFNFDYEHWDDGNYDDSYEYVVECGE